uniref:Integrase catalytic domain-containing protein n=1 Tax=Cannabis sativa TaxID=3483 RepID=A0A803NT75_CANSA
MPKRSNASNMVSEQWPPLLANMATIDPGNSNSHPTQQGAPAATTRNQTREHDDTTVYFNHTISIKLNDHNYFLWKQQILVAICGNRLMKFIQDTPPPPQYLSDDDQAARRLNPVFVNWDVQDQLLVSWLISSMIESLLTRMVGCNSARQIWKALEQHYTLKVSSKILEFRTKLQKLKKGTLSLNDYLLKVKQHVDLLASVGEVLSDRDHIAAIFKGLPSEYDTFIISTNTRIEGYTVGEIEALLLASESRIEKEDQEVEFSANLATAEQDQDQDPAMEAFLAQSNRNYRPYPSTRGTDDNWYPDSGASNHCTPNGQNIMTPTEFEGPDQLYVGNGAGLPISQIAYLLSNSCNKPLVLTNLLHVPELTKNLLSVSKFAADNNVYFVFYPDMCYVKDQCSSSNNNFELWHNRLGHPSERVVKSVLSQLHRKPCPTTHEQNGIAERKHRHIVEHVLALLAHANRPLKYWDEAFRTAVYLHNRLPTPVLSQKSPIEVLFNLKPDYSILKTFGCTCFPNIRPYNKHKLEFRSSPCNFIGYSLNHKGYKCIDKNGRLYISRDVIFDENTFLHNSTSIETDPSSHIMPATSATIPIASKLYTVGSLFPDDIAILSPDTSVFPITCSHPSDEGPSNMLQESSSPILPTNCVSVPHQLPSVPEH